jgi:hypothetical protein
MNSARLLAVMGSGETTPTMVTAHRQLADLDPVLRPGEAVLVETPYGFQENADDISARARSYFSSSVGLDVAVAPGLRRPAERADADTDRGVASVAAARWLFAGPGSPTYALDQWSGSGVQDALVSRLGRPGVTIFSSAAACTLGRYTVPVYEIYKVGQAPHWCEGLDLTATFGLTVAVIPHFDNAEGGNHDTRFCYLGERRLVLLETQLPPDVGVLGIDEHTEAVVDLDAATLTVGGRGVVTLRHRDRSQRFPAGTVLGMEQVAAALAGRDAAGATASTRPPHSASAAASASAESAVDAALADGPPPDAGPSSLADAVARCERAFDDAAGRRDATGMTEAVLDLDRAILAWSGDTLQSDEVDRAHAVLRACVVRLGAAAGTGLVPPEVVLAPLVTPLVALRQELRADREFSISDRLRDLLAAAGVELRDTPDGPAWSLADGSASSPGSAPAPAAHPGPRR